jgi:hypothetical protein
MSHSRTTLNAPFYEWIDEVRRAFRKEKELLGKLEYYNVKFIGYKGISYGQIITNPMPRNDKDMLYWMDKIDEIEKKIKKIKQILYEFDVFLSFCSQDEIEIVMFLTTEYLKFDKKQKTLFYKRINKIARKLIIYRKIYKNSI